MDRRLYRPSFPPTGPTKGRICRCRPPISAVTRIRNCAGPPAIGGQLRQPAWRFSVWRVSCGGLWVHAVVCRQAEGSKQIEIFVVLPGGDVGFAAGLRGEAVE